MASRLLEALERSAAADGIGSIHLSSSLTAVPFYLQAGFRELRRAIHRFPSGAGLIACVEMAKPLP